MAKKATAKTIAAAHMAAPEGNQNCAASAAAWHDRMTGLGAGGVGTESDVPMGLPGPMKPVAHRRAPVPYQVAAATHGGRARRSR
jgi:hypothetical protein